MALITDLRHFLNEAGELAEMPGPAVRIATFLCSIVRWRTGFSGARTRTNVWCRRSPGRRHCRGEIEAEYTDGRHTIAWGCPECGDRGFLHGWEGTRWDMSHQHNPPLQPTGFAGD